MEGAALGGRVMALALARDGPPELLGARRFLLSDGPGWPALLRRLDDAAPTPKARRDTAAEATFATFERWMNPPSEAAA